MGNYNAHGPELLKAAEVGNTADVRKWIEKGADPCSRRPTSEWNRLFVYAPNASALSMATRNGHVDTVKVLLELGGGGLIPTDDFDILQFARSPEMIETLISAGASVNACDTHGKTPLHWHTEVTGGWAHGGGLEAIKLLVSHGAIVDCGQQSALMQACEEGDLEIFNFLLASGANIHYETEYSYTCQDFVRHGVNWNVSPPEGPRAEEKSAIMAVLDKAGVRGVCLDQNQTFKGQDVSARDAREWLNANPQYSKR